jgi:hypothetical protein
VRDGPDDRSASALASSIMASATICQLKDDARELAALFASLSPDERARLMVLMFGDDG